MLQTFQPRSLDEKYKLLNQFDLVKNTWVVADLNSKSIVQNQLLKNTNCLPEDAVVRINELWKKILKCEFPEYEIVSSHYVSILLKDWLTELDYTWAKHVGTPQLLLQYISSLMAVVTSLDNCNLVRDWLRSNPDAFLRWGHWFELSVRTWNFFKEKKILTAKWVAPFLNSQNFSIKYWNRNLIIDVGADLTSIEIELLQKLKKQFNVTVIIPEDVFIKKYDSCLWPYKLIVPQQKNSETNDAVIPVEIETYRFTTKMAEIKAATAQVRKWLEEGIALESISILASDIEEYWPFLSTFMEQEGVPVAKDKVAAGLTFPALSRWLSRLKLECGQLDNVTLESSLYESQMPPLVQYEKFKHLFNQIYDHHDLSREKSVKDFFDFQYISTNVISRDDFFSWSLKYWEGDSRLLESLAAIFLTECPTSTRLKVQSWIAYVSHVAAQIEVKVHKSQLVGINVQKFEMAQNDENEYVILLGLDEKSLKTESNISISRSDVEKLIADLDLYIESQEQHKGAYLVDKIIKQTRKKVLLYYATTDFSGRAQAPSLMWLSQTLTQKQNIEKVDVPGFTRWDELQLMPEEMHSSILLNRMKQDTGHAIRELVSDVPPLRYSPSQLEKYLECPFIFTAEKLFHLSQLPDIDLDVDAMTSGRILHSCLDKIMGYSNITVFSTSKLAHLVDDVRSALSLPIADERLWPLKRSYYVEILNSFIVFENKWRIQFPNTETVGRELRVKGEMALNNGKKIKVSGQIDRVDTDGEHYVVIDYKTSGYNLRNHGSWLNNNNLQLAFYALALEQGLTELPAKIVIGAIYFTLVDLNRDKGFKIKDVDQELFVIGRSDRSAMTAEQYNKMIAEIKSKIENVVKKIERGELSAEPSDTKICADCDWNTLCRAPHLN